MFPVIPKCLESQSATIDLETVSGSYTSQSEKNQDQSCFGPTSQEKTTRWAGQHIPLKRFGQGCRVATHEPSGGCGFHVTHDPRLLLLIRNLHVGGPGPLLSGSGKHSSGSACVGTRGALVVAFGSQRLQAPRDSLVESCNRNSFSQVHEALALVLRRIMQGPRSV